MHWWPAKSKAMRCEFCGESNAPSVRIYPHRSAGLCPGCAPVFACILTIENGESDAREVMINQHAGEPRRKLLELRDHYITAFLSDSLEIIALEIESKSPRMVILWRRHGMLAEFTVKNVGRSYFNRDEMIPGRGFDFDALRKDVAKSGANLQQRVRLALDACQALEKSV
jgi:hypothetical protein